MNQFNLSWCSELLQIMPPSKSVYVQVTPNSLGRFGHQFHNIIAGILLAQALGGQCLRPSFTGNSKCWNKVLAFAGRHICTDWTNLNFTILNGVAGKYVAMESVKLYYNYSLRCCDPALLICLQPDQFAGSLLKLLPRSILELRQGLSFKPHDITSPEIAIHLRRGDVTPNYASSLFTDFDTYLLALGKISDVLPAQWPVTIYSEGNSVDFEYLARRIEVDFGRRVSYCLEKNLFSLDASSDFTRMTCSGALICSYSTYAYCALYFSSHLGLRFFIADSRSVTAEGMLQLEVFRSLGVNIVELWNQ